MAKDELRMADGASAHGLRVAQPSQSAVCAIHRQWNTLASRAAKFSLDVIALKDLKKGAPLPKLPSQMNTAAGPTVFFFPDT